MHGHRSPRVMAAILRGREDKPARASIVRGEGRVISCPLEADRSQRSREGRPDGYRRPLQSASALIEANLL